MLRRIKFHKFMFDIKKMVSFYLLVGIVLSIELVWIWFESVGDLFEAVERFSQQLSLCLGIVGSDFNYIYV
jgi:hypothetical protein